MKNLFSNFNSNLVDLKGITPCTTCGYDCSTSCAKAYCANLCHSTCTENCYNECNDSCKGFLYR